MRIPWTSRAAEWDSIRCAFYQTSDRLLQQNRHETADFRAAAIPSASGGTSAVPMRCPSGELLTDARSGIQSLLVEAANRKFDIVYAEALDRISRDQEDVAGVYKRLRFADVRI